MSSFEEVKRVLKKLMEKGNVEVVENPTFMTETRRKELERERLRDESMSMSIPVVVEDKKKFLIFIIAGVRGESEAHIAAAIQQPVVDRNGNGKLWVHPLFLLPPPKVLLPPKLAVLLRNRAVLLRKGGSSEA